jgi:hypothetical protein
MSMLPMLHVNAITTTILIVYFRFFGFYLHWYKITLFVSIGLEKGSVMLPTTNRLSSIRDLSHCEWASLCLGRCLTRGESNGRGA